MAADKTLLCDCINVSYLVNKTVVPPVREGERQNVDNITVYIQQLTYRHEEHTQATNKN